MTHLIACIFISSIIVLNKATQTNHFQLTIITSTSHFTKDTDIVGNITEYLTSLHIDATFFPPKVPDTDDNLCSLFESMTTAIFDSETRHYITYISPTYEITPSTISQCAGFAYTSTDYYQQLKITNIKYALSHVRNTRNLLATVNNEWIAPSQPQLDGALWCATAFSYNNSLYFYGGGGSTTINNNNANRQDNDLRSIEYNILENRLTYQYNILPRRTFGCSQFYTQRSHLFYWIDREQMGQTPNKQSFIMVYNIESKQFEPNITIDNRMNTQWGCLASNEFMLAVLDDNLYIYNVSTEQWMSNLTAPQQGRLGFACIIHPLVNQLFAISGWDTKTVERISLNDVSSQAWEFIDSLPLEMANSRAVVYKKFIMLVAGGWDCGSQCDSYSVYYSQTFLINCYTGEITNGSHLAYGVRSTSTVLTNDVIYVWGGPGVYSWQYLNLSNVDLPTTLNPTTEPTAEPTSEPTIEPSMPTMEPTFYPVEIEATNIIVRPSYVTSLYHESEDDNSEKNKKLVWIYLVIVIIILCVFIFCLVSCIIYKDKICQLRNRKHLVSTYKEPNEKKIPTNDEMLELETVTDQNAFVD